MQLSANCYDGSRDRSGQSDRHVDASGVRDFLVIMGSMAMVERKDMPIRIQRKRAKGWRLPANTVCITRGTRFGNPFAVGTMQQHPLEHLGKVLVEDNRHATILFQNWLLTSKEGHRMAALIRRELRGKNVACFCHPEDYCHGDEVLKVANERADDGGRRSSGRKLDSCN
jgi:Domain of unknown function (DUF4326)